MREHMKIKPLYEEAGTSKYFIFNFQIITSHYFTIIVNFDVLEEILAASLVRSLRLPVKETPLLFTENSIHNKELRLKLTEFLFERFQAPSIFLCKDSVLSAFACGRSTAVVLDSGAD